MTEKIGGLPRPGTDTKPTGSHSASVARRAEAKTHEDGRSSGGRDAISLTDTVTRLKTIEARIQELPDIDRERVAEIRRLIDTGEFEIDAGLIAQRIVRLEKALS